MNAVQFVERAASLGLTLVQMADNLPLQMLSPAELDELALAGSRLNVRFELGTRGLGNVPAYIDLCLHFQSTLLRLVVDAAGEHPTESAIVATIKALVPELAAAGVTLAIENHDRFRAHEFARMIESIGSPNVDICLDTVNSFGALEGPEVVIGALAPHVVNLHLKDFDVRRLPHMMGFEIGGAPAGQGRLNVPGLLDTLRANGRDFNVILELWPPLDRDIESTIHLERAWCQQSVSYLKELIPEPH